MADVIQAARIDGPRVAAASDHYLYDRYQAGMSNTKKRCGLLSLSVQDALKSPSAPWRGSESGFADQNTAVRRPAPVGVPSRR